MDKKILEINSAIDIAKKKYKEGDLVKASEIYKNLINQLEEGGKLLNGFVNLLTNINTSPVIFRTLATPSPGS